MEAPNPLQDEIVLKLTENENEYTLKFSLQSNSLVINVSEGDTFPQINYNSKFILSDLVKLSKYFKLFDTLEELMPEIKNLCNEKKIKLKKEKSSISLTLLLPLKVVEEVHLTIPQAEIDSKQIISDLCTTVNELKKEIKLLRSNQITDEQLNKNLQSKDILLNEEEKVMVHKWILKRMKSEGKKIEMTLLYKLTNHGDSSSTFHSYCNNKGYTLTLIRNTKGYRCGGFTSQSWSSSGNYKADPNAFLFSLEFKEYYPTYDGTNAIYDHSSYGPTFGNGHDLYIVNSCSNSNSSYCNFPYSYCGARQRALSGGVYNFKVNEIEVYKIDIV